MATPARPAPEPTFFATAEHFRAWFVGNHASAEELLVGYWKVGTGKPSMTWSESVDVALCFGWIDGVRRRHDADSYTIRFTPRRPGSIWSTVNVAKVEALRTAGRMEAPGLAAFEARRADRTGVYSHEVPDDASLALTEAETAALTRVPDAAAFFATQPPSYRRAVAHWLHGAKRPETRERRLGQLVAESAAGRRVPPLRAR